MKISFKVSDIDIDKNIWIKFNILIDNIEEFDDNLRGTGNFFVSDAGIRLNSDSHPEINEFSECLFIQGRGYNRDTTMLRCSLIFFISIVRAIHEFNLSLQES